jgi:hypothetical protein
MMKWVIECDIERFSRNSSDLNNQCLDNYSMARVPLRRLLCSSQFIVIKLLTKGTKSAKFAKLGQTPFDFMQKPMVVLAARETDECSRNECREHHTARQMNWFLL